MIPLWMFPLAIACGNTFIMKPSERDPGAAMLLAKLAHEAGVPAGVLNVIHGGADGMSFHIYESEPLAVNFILDEPRIKAVSFVGSDHVGHHIWERGTKNGKRVQVCCKCVVFSHRFSLTWVQRTMVSSWPMPTALPR